MSDQDSKATLFAKMARVMAQLERLPQNGYNAHFKYRFTTNADVSDAVRKALAVENVAFFVELIEATREGDRTVVDLAFTFACGDTGETLTKKWKAEANDKQDKGLAKAYTAGLKYFLLKTFILSTGEEPDSDIGPSQTSSESSPPVPSQKRNGYNEAVAIDPKKLFDIVQSKTENGYRDMRHLNEVIGGWPNFNDLTSVDQAVQKAIDHAGPSSVEEGSTPVTEEEIPF